MNQNTDDNHDSATRAAPEASGGKSGPDPDSTEAEPGTGAAPDGWRGESTDNERPDEPGYAPDRTVPPASTPRRGVSSAAAWLALLLALLALAGSGYLAWQDRERSADEAGTEAAITSLSAELDTALKALESRQQAALGELGNALRQGTARIDFLEREIGELRRQNESVYPRLGNLEDAVSSLQGVSAGVRETWMLAEAEYYLQIANAQLQLAGKPDIAALALQYADERIRQLANPALAEVRRALAGELQALRSMETPDIEGMSLALSNLAKRTATLPLNQDVDVPDAETDGVDPELTGFSRAVASIKSAFGDIVSVRRSDEPLTPLLAPEAAYFLKANLALKLQAARLALLQGERQVYEQSLSDASEWLEAYYDPDSSAVASVLTTIEGLQAEGAGVSPPDISESLRLLRQYRTLKASASPAGNVASDREDVSEPGNGTSASEQEQ